MAWQSYRRATTADLALALVAIVALCAAIIGRAPGSAWAYVPSTEVKASLDSTVRFLQSVQNADGGFGAVKAGESDPDFSAWVALALGAAGVNPQDQAQPGGSDAYSYLAEHAGELQLTTDFERALLVVDAAGTSPHDFGGIDLVAKILERKLPDGSFVHQAGDRVGAVSDTAFAILALALVREPTVQEAIRRAATWLIDEQNADRSWSPTCARSAAGCMVDGEDPQGEVDATAAVVEALNAAGMPNTEAQQKAFEYLHEAQGPDGGFPEFRGEAESNVASTAWAAQAIWSAAENPEEWTDGTSNPLDYMASLQQPDGSVRWKANADANRVWMTAYVAPAFAGRALPIAAVPRSAHAKPTSPSVGATTPPAQGQAEAGQGGESTQPGSGVIAGGGGSGARLFSRPKPQSHGSTPGGVRLLGSTHRKPAAKNAAKSRAAATGSHAPAPVITATSELDAARSARSPGSAGHRQARVLTQREAERGAQGSERVVKGVLIGESVSADGAASLKVGAPGLHSAGAGGNQTPWLAIAINAAIVLLAAGGSQLERRRPQVSL